MPRRSPRALALWGAALVVAVVTAAIVAGDLAALHRRAAGLGPERRRRGRHPRPRRRHRARRHATSGRAACTGRSSRMRWSPTASPSWAASSPCPVVEGRVRRCARNVAPAPSHAGSTASCRAGMRAIRVVVTDALEPRPGAAVDVLATYDLSSSAVGSRRRHDRGRRRRRRRAARRPARRERRGPGRRRGRHAAGRSRAGPRPWPTHRPTASSPSRSVPPEDAAHP